MDGNSGGSEIFSSERAFDFNKGNNRKKAMISVDSNCNSLYVLLKLVWKLREWKELSVVSVLDCFYHVITFYLPMDNVIPSPQ